MIHGVTGAGIHPTRAVAVVISGAPGSGKTTLGRLLGDEMRLPHLNKDVLNSSLIRGGVSSSEANQRAYQLFYGTARNWLASSMSLVLDVTMYPEFSVAEVRSLQAHGVVVNVHCRATNALARWEHKMRTIHPGHAEAIIERGRPVQDIATEPLDFACPRIEVDTTEGYKPSLDEIVAAVETFFSPAPAGQG